MPQLDPSSFLSQLFWLVISFTLLYVVLTFVLLPRIRSILENRQFTIDKGLTEARLFRDQAQAALLDYQSALSEARAESAKIMQNASLAYQKESSETLSAVEKDIESRLEKAQTQLDISRQKAKVQATEASLAIAQDLVKSIAGFDANPQSLRNLIQETC